MASSAATAGTINFNKDSNNSGQFSIGQNYTLNVASGVSVSTTTAFNVWGSNSFLNIAEGAKVSANGGVCLASGSIAGEVISTGAMGVRFNAVWTVVWGFRIALNYSGSNGFNKAKLCCIPKSGKIERAGDVLCWRGDDCSGFGIVSL